MTSTTRHSSDPEARWRVALLAPADDVLAGLRSAIVAAGGRVVLEAPPRASAIARLPETRADVVILRPPSQGAQPPDLLPFTCADCPLVLFMRDSRRTTLKHAARAGVAAFLAEPLYAPQLAPTLDLAVARFSDAAVLRRKLADRKVIERAKGHLMALARVTEDEAFRWLRTRAMNTRSNLADVARAVLTDEHPPRIARAAASVVASRATIL
jgi:response regulator NasT